METTNYIAQCRIDDCATVRVLSITPNKEIICDQECSSLKESKDGSIQCYIGWIKKMGMNIACMLAFFYRYLHRALHIIY